MRIFASLLIAGFALLIAGTLIGMRGHVAPPVEPAGLAGVVPAATAAVQAAPTSAPDAPLARELVVSGDTVSLREAALEREVASLRAQLADLTFARAAAVDVTLAHVLQALDDSHLTRKPELRALFIAQVRPVDALRLLEAEDRLRDRLAKTRSSMLGTPALTYEWPVKRDQLVQTFFRELADAGLSERAIELYRVAIADYL